MFSKIRSLVGLATVAATIGGCSASTVRPPLATNALTACPGGSVVKAEDLSRFKDCGQIAGNLRIENSSLEGLDALKNLVSVSGALVIKHNPRLENLDGLRSLRAVGSLQIRDNAELASVEGLGALESSLRVSLVSNPKLRRLTGLSGISELNSLVLSKNGLYSTSGLEGLREVGDLVIAQNRYLISLGGLSGLRRARSIRIQGNPRICAQAGLLPQLTEVAGPLELRANSGLFADDVSRLTARAKSGESE